MTREKREAAVHLWVVMIGDWKARRTGTEGFERHARFSPRLERWPEMDSQTWGESRAKGAGKLQEGLGIAQNVQNSNEPSLFFF